MQRDRASFTLPPNFPPIETALVPSSSTLLSFTFLSIHHLSPVSLILIGVCRHQRYKLIICQKYLCLSLHLSAYSPLHSHLINQYLSIHLTDHTCLDQQPYIYKAASSTHSPTISSSIYHLANVHLSVPGHQFLYNNNNRRVTSVELKNVQLFPLEAFKSQVTLGDSGSGSYSGKSTAYSASLWTKTYSESHSLL